MESVVQYIIDFLARLPVSESGIVHYGNIEDALDKAKVVIVSAFPSLDIKTLPQIPLKTIDDTPILFGDSKVETQNGKLIIYADIIASSFFLLSRYEEILKPKCRDNHGRFCAKDSIIFQQCYGNRPIVDEYSILFRKWIKDAGVNVPEDKAGFSKIYLTHDVDVPFRFEYFSTVCKQIIKNLFHYNICNSPLKKYFNEQLDDNYTFPKMINYDRILLESLTGMPVECIYFFITIGTFFNRKYYNFFSKKMNRLLNYLNLSGAKIGLHLSYEAGLNPDKIKMESKLLMNKIKLTQLISRHHFLKWQEPGDIKCMEQAGIKEDFTLSYADNVGFRVGTCRPYRFINPQMKELTNVIIHPMEIMDCTLNRRNYMNLDFEDAFCKCREIINQVYKHNGELVLLWHNTEFLGKNYQEKLYGVILEYIGNLYK
jgi:hypothetical protein